MGLFSNLFTTNAGSVVEGLSQTATSGSQCVFFHIVFDLTDHPTNFIIINKFNTLPKHIKFTRRDYSKYNEEALLQDCRSIDWNCTNTDFKNITMMFDSFHNKLKNVINKHIPLKQLSQKDIKQISKPWITRGIQKSIKVKNKYYKKFISNRPPYYQSKFKTYRNKLNHLIKLSEISYYNKYFDSNKSNIKNIWKGIKQLISLKHLSSKLPTKIINNDIELVDAKDIANAFNNFFVNVGPNIASTIPADHSSNISPEM